MQSISRLIRDPSIRNGALCIRGTDITVEQVEKLIEADNSTEVIKRKLPRLDAMDIEAVREFMRLKEETLFSCVKLTKKYENNVAIDNLTYSTKSRTLGLFGPNGSGKSTLIRLLLGLHFPDDGLIEVHIDKTDIRVVPDFPTLPEQMTIDEWMDSLEQIYGDPLLNVDFQDEFRLEGHWKLGDLSAGQYRLAAVLPMFYGTPKLVVLDEPTNFLDAYIRDKLLKMMKSQINESFTKVIIASHRIEEINLFAERVLMLHQGKMLADIDMADDIELQFEVRVDNFEDFVSHLAKRKVEFTTEITSLGKTVILKIDRYVWTSLKQYMEAGSIIYSINKIDKLQAKLKEVIR